MQAEDILIGCFVECQSIKKVGGRRSVELYQAVFFVSPIPPECFTERNENRALSQVTRSYESKQTQNHTKEKREGREKDGEEKKLFTLLLNWYIAGFGNF